MSLDVRGLRVLLLAFLVGAATMVLELAAPRLLAPHLGTTTLVWTVTIATFLGGLAMGNAWGGRLADARGSRWGRLLFLLTAAAAVLSMALEALGRHAFFAVGLALRTLLTVPLAFLPVAILLGMIPPYLARSALPASRQKGRTLGRLAAAGAAGSVLGTALAGFLLVPRMGTRGILATVAAVLLVAAVLVPEQRSLAGRRPARHVPSTRSSRPVSGASLMLAALAGASLLLLEIALGRLGAASLGSSIYTWTSTIGVVLAGCAIGGALGGRLADRRPPRPLLATLLGLAVIASLALAWAPTLMDGVRRCDASMPWPWRVVVAVGLTGFVPALAIGTLSPVIIRAALGAPAMDGRIVGTLYGAGTVGAVLATLAASYVLLPALGLEATLLGVPLLLLVGRTVVRRRLPWILGPAWIALAVILLAPGTAPHATASALWIQRDDSDVVLDDSRYARIRVEAADDRWIPLEAEPDRMGLRTDLLLKEHVVWDPDRFALYWEGPMGIQEQARLRTHMTTEADRRAVQRLRRLAGQDVRILRLDRLIHSYVNLDDATYLGYDYERVYDAVLRRVSRHSKGRRVMFLGGGGYTFQRRLLALPDAPPISILTVEIDEAVTRTARRHLALEDDPRHAIVHADARTHVASMPSDAPRFDVVFGDAFDDLAVPFHLTTLEFAEQVAGILAPDGIYVVNMVDTFDSGRFLAAFVYTLEQVFDYVRVLTAPPRMDDMRNTFVLVASHAPLDLADLEDENGRPLRTVEYSRAEIEALEARTGRRVLRDDHAPVEMLLAPVVKARE